MDGMETEWTLHGRPVMTMSSAVPILSLLICAVPLFPTSAGTSRISSRLPQQILLNTSLQVVNPPVRMDILSVRWEHNERPLVEYRDGNLTFHSPSAMMYMEEIMQGNISLVLTNLTLSHAGNYTCVVQYDGVLQTVIYDLIIETQRIYLLNLTPPPRKTGVSLLRSNKKRTFLNVDGEREVTAEMGDNVTLPCYFQLDANTEVSVLTVHWIKDGVTTFFGNKTCCNVSDYEIFEENLANGRAPLTLVNVQETDVGVYTCSITSETMEGSWNTTFHINRQSGHLITTTQRTTDDSIVADPMPQYRTLKYGLVSGVVAVTGLLAVFLYFCYEG